MTLISSIDFTLTNIKKSQNPYHLLHFTLPERRTTSLRTLMALGQCKRIYGLSTFIDLFAYYWETTLTFVTYRHKRWNCVFLWNADIFRSDIKNLKDILSTTGILFHKLWNRLTVTDKTIGMCLLTSSYAYCR